MEEALALIENIIDEHRVIKGRVQSLEQAASDASAILGLGEAKEAFMPGRLDQKQGLQKMQELLETIDQGLEAHFEREETGLLAAFEKHGDREIVSALRSLLLEHEDLKHRFAHSKKQVAELASGELSRHVWEASAHDIRAYISHTLKSLEGHAQLEHELLLSVRKQLRGE